MRRWCVLLAALPCALTACSGPTKPINIGVHSLATSFHYGVVQAGVAGPAVPGAAPAPPLGPFAPIPSVGYPAVPELPLASPVVVPAPPACPDARPAAIVQRPTANVITKPPAAAKYTFRDVGTFQDSASHRGAYPATQTREVKDSAAESNGDMSFTVITVLGDQTSKISYHYVAPGPASRSAAGAEPIAGLYMTGDVKEQGGKVKSSFHPQGPGLLLLETPALAQSTWQSTATDATTGTTVFVTGTIGAKKLVNACGEVIETVPVHIDGRVKIYQPGLVPGGADPGPDAGGQNVSPSGAVTFTADYYFAPQYGGLIVQDKVETTGSLGTNSLKTSLLSTINSLPIAR
jgi:hypothetical protein